MPSSILWWRLEQPLPSVSRGSTSQICSQPYPPPPPPRIITIPHIEEDELGLEHHLHFGHHMIAGALAGMAEHMIMFPIDTVKTRMQVVAPGLPLYDGVLSTMRHIVKEEGYRKLFRGIAAVGLGAGPAHSLYFAVYELLKERWGGTGAKHVELHNPLRTAVAGAVATFASESIFVPADTVKQRMQMSPSLYKNIFHCSKLMYQSEGLLGFYASLPTTLIMNVPFTMVHFTTYESVRHFLVPDGSFTPLAHIASGCIGGASAAAVTTPLDVIKTQLQTQGGTGRHYTGMFHVMRTIYSELGYRGFFRGIIPRIMFHMPASAFCWTVYETAKWVLKDELDSPK